MQFETAILSELWLERGALAGRIACPPALRPAPGQYLLASAWEDASSPFPVALFPSAYAADGFSLAPPLPPAWGPGERLSLRGPLGCGFALPGNLSRLALAALGATPSRLLPLVQQALARGAAVTLYCDVALLEGKDLPLALEVSPLEALPEGLAWADFLALDLPLSRLAQLGSLLGLAHAERPLCPAQALLLAPMPCGGVAECGVCAVPARRGYKLACKDGPVFDLNELDW